MSEASNGGGASPSDPGQPIQAPRCRRSTGSIAATRPPGLGSHVTLPSGSSRRSTGSRLATTTKSNRSAINRTPHRRTRPRPSIPWIAACTAGQRSRSRSCGRQQALLPHQCERQRAVTGVGEQDDDAVGLVVAHGALAPLGVGHGRTDRVGPVGRLLAGAGVTVVAVEAPLGIVLAEEL